MLGGEPGARAWQGGTTVPQCRYSALGTGLQWQHLSFHINTRNARHYRIGGQINTCFDKLFVTESQLAELRLGCVIRLMTGWQPGEKLNSGVAGMVGGLAAVLTPTREKHEQGIN